MHEGRTTIVNGNTTASGTRFGGGSVGAFRPRAAPQFCWWRATRLTDDQLTPYHFEHLRYGMTAYRFRPCLCTHPGPVNNARGTAFKKPSDSRAAKSTRTQDTRLGGKSRDGDHSRRGQRFSNRHNRKASRGFVTEVHDVAASNSGHRERNGIETSDRSSGGSGEHERRTGRSKGSGEVLEKGVERGGGEVERPA